MFLTGDTKYDTTEYSNYFLADMEFDDNVAEHALLQQLSDLPVAQSFVTP